MGEDKSDTEPILDENGTGEKIGMAHKFEDDIEGCYTKTEDGVQYLVVGLDESYIMWVPEETVVGFGKHPDEDNVALAMYEGWKDGR